MRHRTILRRGSLAGLIALLTLLIWAMPAFAEAGVIEGKLHNGTAGADLPGAMEVALEKLNADGTLAATQQTKVDREGSFRFALDASPAYTYTVSAKYQQG